MKPEQAGETAWRSRVAKVLGEQDFSVLQSLTPEGLLLQPLYAAGTGIAPRPMRRRAAAPWAIVQRMDNPDAAAAALQAHDDLTEGADGLHLCLAGSDSAFGFGVPVQQLAEALAATELDRQDVHVSVAPLEAEALVNGAAALLASKRTPASLTRLSFDFDPLTVQPLTISALLEMGFSGPLMVASGRGHHNRGADAVQEMAAVLSTAVNGLRLLESLGLPPAETRRLLALELCADADVFMGVAKFRAMRLLWAEIEAACGLKPEPVRLRAETSYRMQAARDVATNMLRNTLAVFAAAIGGADAITVLPHSLVRGLPDAFTRRIARNQQIILIEESHLASVADPASGSGAFDSLTEELTEKVWHAFTEMEAQGGVSALLHSGAWAQSLAAARQKRVQAVREKQSAILGVTIYPDPTEKPPAVLLLRDAAGDAFTALRDAAPFEAESEAA